MSPPAESDRQFDLIVLGSGSAGSSAAQRARSAGCSVAVIEKDKVGGDCPNYACVPTKALLRSAKIYSLFKHANAFGLQADGARFEWAKVMARKEAIVQQTGAGMAAEHYQREGLSLLRGVASFEDAQHIRVGERVLRGQEHVGDACK